MQVDKKAMTQLKIHRVRQLIQNERVRIIHIRKAMAGDHRYMADYKNNLPERLDKANRKMWLLKDKLYKMTDKL